jgi:hypothetical protein
MEARDLAEQIKEMAAAQKRWEAQVLRYTKSKAFLFPLTVELP